MTTQIVNGAAGGRHIAGGPLTLQKASEIENPILKNDIDSRIVRVRPMSTPIDQLSRCGFTRHCGSMTVEYYSVDTKKTSARVSVDVPSSMGTRKAGEIYSHIIRTDDDFIFEPSETLLVPDVKGGADDAAPAGPLVLYVLSRPESGGIEVKVINPVKDDEGTSVIPHLPVGTSIVRMGRAATELDVQTPQFQALPSKSSNNCQIFKMQVEESTFHKIASKEIGWSFSDQEEAAIIDMRLGMEKNFLFGARACFLDPAKNENVYLTGGIWSQAPRACEVLLDEFSEDNLLDICVAAFTDNCGSKRKILIAGTELIDAISRVSRNKVVLASDTFVKWGIEFKEIRSNFGSLYIIHSEIFDQCGHAADGMVIDPDYLTKYVHVPFHTEQLDLRRAGTRNTSAVVITEASCLVLRYPAAHLRVVGTKVGSSASASVKS